MTKIVVTGASGRLGREVTRDLLDHGHDVRAVDAIVAPVDRRVTVLQTELTDYGQTIDALAGCEVVVHLANIPAPGVKPAAHTFQANVTANANVQLYRPVGRRLGTRHATDASPRRSRPTAATRAGSFHSCTITASAPSTRGARSAAGS